MEMFLMGLCVAVFGMAVACAAFGAATRPELRTPAVQPQEKPVVAPAATDFFTDDVPLPIAARPMRPRRSPQAEVSLAALLAQIENHIRLEQAAAESFVETPTPMLLQSKTTSTFIN
jgi:hypothetical protein